MGDASTVSAMPHQAMRHLIVMRHAKAERVTGKRDFDRALVERGWRDADKVASEIAAEGLVPDHVLCSAARRTRDTLCAVMPYLSGECTIELRHDLYDADATDLRIALTAMQGECVLVIGHNPAVHGLAVALSGQAPEARVLACGFPTSHAALFAIPDGPDSTRFERLFSR